MKQRAIVTLLFVAFVPLHLCAAEPSAFGAGDLSSPEPYGLTSSEKVLLQTKEKLNKIALQSKTQENKIDALRERIDGLQSIVESIGRKTHNQKIALQKFETDQKSAWQSSSEYQSRLRESIEENSRRIEDLGKMLFDLSKHLESIAADYVTKEEHNKLVESLNKFKAVVAKELRGGAKTKSKKISSAELYNLAKKNFDRKYYTKAIENYEELIRRKYKPAYAHYMIGEMYFKRKDYAKALAYFKKSTKLYSKASYMPKLMLHSALAMHRTGDKAHARAFFEAIVAKYPNSQEAKEAKKYLR